MGDTNIILVRHGETYLNKYNRMQGWADSPLTPEGAEHVRKSIKKLLNKNISRIYSSDMTRTRQTSELIVDEYLNENSIKLGIELDSDLREICFGSLEGELSDVAWKKVASVLGYQTMVEMFENESITSVYDTIASIDLTNDAETAEVFSQRLNKSISKIGKLNKGNTVVIVTHGNVIRLILNQISGSGIVEKNIENGQSFVLKYTENGLSI